MEQAPSQAAVSVVPVGTTAFTGSNDVDVVASFRSLGYFVGKGWVNLQPPAPGQPRHLVFETELGGVSAEIDLVEGP